MVIVFDLDDTLFRELDFVHSGFRAVANFLAKERGLDADALCAEFVAQEQLSRNGVFDTVLARHALTSAALRKQCLSIYRLHAPDIALPADTLTVLDALKQRYPLYVVTDGNKRVQANKLRALGLTRWIKKGFVTHHFGIRHAKPSPYCFMKIVDLEGCAPADVVYVADNIKKDFVGIKPLGFKTVRVMQGNYAHLDGDDAYQAQHTIAKLADLPGLLAAAGWE